MAAVTDTVDLRALLELRSAMPVDLEGDTLLLRCDLPGTMQLFLTSLSGGGLQQVTDFADPVEGKFVPGSQRILVEHDEAGNENVQFSLLTPGSRPEPLVHDSRFFHRQPHFSRDGGFLAYSSNREDGVNWGVYVRSLAEGSERTAVPPTSSNAPAGFSPDGGLLTVLRATGKANDDDLLLVDLTSGTIEHLNPRVDEAEVGEPVWAPDGRSFLVATNEGRDTKAIARYDIAAARWETVIEADWDLECHGDDAGRTLLVYANEDG
jgi:hypothetical protein